MIYLISKRFGQREEMNGQCVIKIVFLSNFLPLKDTPNELLSTYALVPHAENWLSLLETIFFPKPFINLLVNGSKIALSTTSD